MSEQTATPRMWPTIGAGFRVANRSGSGIACFLVGYLLLSGITVALKRTGMPEMSRDAMSRTASTQPQPPASDTATTPAPQVDGTTPASPPTEPPSLTVTPAPSASPKQQRDEQARAFLNWLKLAWPIAVPLLLLAGACRVWLHGGQLGYLVKQVRGEVASTADYAAEGARLFWPLIGAGALWIAGVVALVIVAVAVFLVVALIIYLLALAHVRIFPSGAFAAIASGVFTMVAVVVGVWLNFRLIFWMVAVAVERCGLINGLRASWRVTKGRVWRLTLFGLCVFVIAIPIVIAMVVLEIPAVAVAGHFAPVLGVVVIKAIGFAVGTYLEFAMLAATIRYYEGLKGATAPSPSAGIDHG